MQQRVCDNYKGTTDAAQPVPPSPGMDRDPSATIESSTELLSREIVDEDTSRVNYAAPRDSVEQGAHIASQEDTAMPVVLIAIFPAHTNFTTKIRTGLIATEDDNAINLDLNADTIFRTWSISSCGRIQTNRMLSTTRSRRSCRAQIATR